MLIVQPWRLDKRLFSTVLVWWTKVDDDFCYQLIFSVLRSSLEASIVTLCILVKAEGTPVYMLSSLISDILNARDHGTNLFRWF